MTRTALSKPLLTGAAILLSAAYLINLSHQTFQEKPDDFPLYVTFIFVPAIVSAASLLAYSLGYKKKCLVIGLIATIICAITCAFDIYLMFVAIDSIMVDFDTSIYGLLYELPLIYFISLIGSLVMKRHPELWLGYHFQLTKAKCISSS